MGTKYVEPPPWMPEGTHGTKHGYLYYRCRCDECTKANAESAARETARRAQEKVPPEIHGKASTYKNWACRCPRCKAAHSTQLKKTRARRKANKVRADALAKRS